MHILISVLHFRLPVTVSQINRFAHPYLWQVLYSYSLALNVNKLARKKNKQIGFWILEFALL